MISFTLGLLVALTVASFTGCFNLSNYRKRKNDEKWTRKDYDDGNCKHYQIDDYKHQLLPNPKQIMLLVLSVLLQSKAQAIQEAQQAELSRITAVANAQTKIAEARGDSAKAVIDASGRAESIRREQAVISPTYIEYIKWSNWDGKLPTTSLGSGTNVLLSK